MKNEKCGGRKSGEGGIVSVDGPDGCLILGMELILLDIVEDTVVDGPGFRTTVYGAGCRHHCPGCHNPQSWDTANGEPVEVEQLAERLLADPFSNITFSGGDPLEQAEAFTALAQLIKAQSRKTIWCYTGYRFEEVYGSPRLSQLLPYVDVLVDGCYNQNLRDSGLFFRGSSNQRLVDVAASREKGEVMLFDYAPTLVLAV